MTSTSSFTEAADFWNAAFFCGSCAVIRRTALQEIGGIAVFNFGNTVKLGALEAAIAKLPTDLKSSDNGTNPATGTPITTTSPVAIRPSGVDVPRFPFLTPWDDAKANFVDVSGLNDGPAGSHGFIVVKDGHFTEGALNRVEAVIRAFDPCLSCSTHAFGEMPLALSLLSAEGKVVDQVIR